MQISWNFDYFEVNLPKYRFLFFYNFSGFEVYVIIQHFFCVNFGYFYLNKESKKKVFWKLDKSWPSFFYLKFIFTTNTTSFFILFWQKIFQKSSKNSKIFQNLRRRLRVFERMSKAGKVTKNIFRKTG